MGDGRRSAAPARAPRPRFRPRPPPRRAFAFALALGLAGLAHPAPAASDDPPSTGASRAVRPAVPAVIYFPAGAFTMGADDEDLLRAVNLCNRDRPFARDPQTVLACAAQQLIPQAPSLCFAGYPVFFRQTGPHAVWLGPFGLDRTEVTVSAYDACVRAGACHPAGVAPGSAMYGDPTQPMVDVTWDDAQDYCRHVGGRLPTEAEWERAARGHDRRTFPWGQLYDPRRANHGALHLPDCTDRADGFSVTAPVGSYPDGASPEGVLDLAGNAAEWVADYWDDDLSQYAALSAQRTNPTGAAHGAAHVVRGGSYRTPPYTLLGTFRGHAGTGERRLDLGFRCAYDGAP